VKGTKPLPIIIGPTCVGKTTFSIELALSQGTEIISCDSRQVYIGMNIGTAKPNYYMQQIIPHHLLDIVFPDEEFNAQLWAKRAKNLVDEIRERKHKTLIVCGTGLYLSAFINGFFPLPEFTKEKKREIKQKIGEIEKNSSLFDYLKEIDKESASRIHLNDTYRIKRAIEIYLLTGKSDSYHRSKIKPKKKENLYYIGLTMDRKKLYRRINQRVDKMMRNGFIEEVERLLALGYNEILNAFQAPGYQELIRYLRGDFSRKDAISETKTRTRNYAKRQFTWFRKIKNVNWFDISGGYKEISKKVSRHI